MHTLNLEEAAEFLKCSDDTIRELAAAGELPAAKVGRAWVFVDVDLVDWLRTKYNACRSTKTENIGTTHSLMQKVSGSGKAHTAQINGKRKKSTTTLDTFTNKESLADLL